MMLLFYRVMPVILVLQTTQRPPYYPPFKSAIDRLGATRILKTAWRFDYATKEQVCAAIRVYLPISDGYFVAEMSEPEYRAADVPSVRRR
jgi:hypothetical protein